MKKQKYEKWTILIKFTITNIKISYIKDISNKVKIQVTDREMGRRYLQHTCISEKDGYL